MLRILVLLGVVGAGAYQVGIDNIQSGVSGDNDFRSYEMSLALDEVKATSVSFSKSASSGTEGRASLSRFYDLMQAGTPGTYSIRANLEANGATDQVWVQLTGIDGTNFKGMISDELVSSSSYQLGDQVTVSFNDVSDWMIQSETAIYGGYSMRFSLNDLPADEAERISKLLRD